MTISVNGRVLSQDLVWDGEFDNESTAQEVKVTLGGHTIVSSSPLLAGELIVLTAKFSSNSIEGYFTREDVQFFKNLEKSQATISLVYETQTFPNVVLQAGGVKVYPIIARPNQASTDWYAGTITFINRGE